MSVVPPDFAAELGEINNQQAVVPGPAAIPEAVIDPRRSVVGGGMGNDPGIQRRWLPLIWCPFVIAWLAGQTIARAQKEQDQEPRIDLPEPQATTLTHEQFNVWADQRVLGPNRTAAACRARLVGRLELTLEHLDRTCAITDAQAKKLRVAGYGDIKRAFDRLDEMKRSFALVKDDPAEVAKLQSEVTAIQPPREGRGLFEDGSIFCENTPEDTDGATRPLAVLEQGAQIEALSTPGHGRSNRPANRRGWWFQDVKRATIQRNLLSRKTRSARSWRGALSGACKAWRLQAAKLPEAITKPMFDKSRLLKCVCSSELNDNFSRPTRGRGSRCRSRRGGLHGDR